jgi:mannan endo-1,4-beta-mannosidase
MAALERAADFLASLVDDVGEPIPVLFRPWHEHTGGWFWWGCDSGTPEQFNGLWRLTVRHLRDRRHLHHLIYVLSPSRHHAGAPDYLDDRFPGLAWVDVLGVDRYLDGAAPAQWQAFGAVVRELAQVAGGHGKLAALAEVGEREGLNRYDGDDWWAGRLLPVLAACAEAPLAWLLTWRNAGPEHHWTPAPGAPGADDFRRFCADGRVVLLEGWRAVADPGGPGGAETVSDTVLGSGPIEPR